MKAPPFNSILKCVILLVSTICGVAGIPFIVAAFQLVADVLLGAGEPIFMAFFVPILLLIGGYLVWFCWLCWFRFSKQAVLHFCGVLAFFVWGLPGNWFDAKFPDSISAILTLSWIVIVIRFYPKVASALTRRIFVERNEGAVV